MAEDRTNGLAKNQDKGAVKAALLSFGLTVHYQGFIFRLQEGHHLSET